MDNLRDLLKQSNEKNNDIAKAIGVNPSILSRFKNGSGRMSKRNLEKLEAYLGERASASSTKQNALITPKDLRGVADFLENNNVQGIDPVKIPGLIKTLIDLGILVFLGAVMYLALS